MFENSTGIQIYHEQTNKTLKYGKININTMLKLITLAYWLHFFSRQLLKSEAKI